MAKLTKLPEDSFYGPGVNMLRDKINEIIEAVNQRNEADGALACPPHRNTYNFGPNTKCKDCGKIWKTAAT